MVNGKLVRGTFFSRIPDTEQKWKCRYGKTRTVKGTGYSNFREHVQSEHPDEYKQLIGTTTTQSSSVSKVMLSMLYSTKAVCIHGWIDYVVMALRPFQLLKTSMSQDISVTNLFARKH